ncbi:MAG: 30S ribosomal protein S4 [Alphaproteobacteria bacterium]|nr:30S ribosomal protein S4 [Alphaproteobacteria bacterium]
MGKRLSAKYKVSRRHLGTTGTSLWGRAKDPVHKRNYGPGQHGPAKRVKRSDYGTQLRAKQMLKAYYDLSEKQFARIYVEASRVRGNTSEKLVGLLEQRLTSVVYRMSLAPTIFSARQLVSHGHVMVNGKRVTVGGYMVKPGDVVELKVSAHQIPMVLQATQTPERDMPEYVEVDHKKFQGKLVRVPSFEEIPYPVVMEPNLVVEYYSR